MYDIYYEMKYEVCVFMFKHGSISNSVSFLFFDIINDTMEYRAAMVDFKKI